MLQSSRAAYASRWHGAREEALRERLRLAEGWLSLLLLTLMLLTMAWSFTAGGLDEGLRIMPWAVLYGVLAGFLMAKGRVPGLLAHPLGLAAGIVCCFLLMAGLIHVPPESVAGLAGYGRWVAELELKAGIVAERLWEWFVIVRGGGVSEDALPFVAQMTALGWLVAFYGAWFYYRSHWVWGAVLPGGLVTFLSVYYAPPRLAIYFVWYLLVALVLVVQANIYRREREWRRARVIYDQYMGLDFLRSGALIALTVIAVVWLLPWPRPGTRVQWGGFETLWQRVQDEWNRLYASLSYREQASSTSFSRTMTLGGSIVLYPTPLMEVKAREPHYWRAVVLDRYTGSGWVDTSSATLDRAAGAALGTWTGLKSRKILDQTFTLLQPHDPLIYAAGEPIVAQFPARVQAFVPLDGADPTGFEVTAIYAAGLARRNRYDIRSLVTTASIRQLRQAGTDYPEWVLSRYLQLPPSLPARVGELAQKVAGGAATPYDQAAAIEAYLRGLRYSLTVEPAPPGHDPVDWFLFDSQEGYCTYFASAMAILCRSLGIPARVAQGYAPGEYVAERDCYLVRHLDSHAWPEVYFPGYGWIEFEPTPALPPLVRPTGEEEAGGGVLPIPGPGERGDEGQFGEPPVPPPERGPEDVGLPPVRTLLRQVAWLRLVVAVLAVTGCGWLAWRGIRRWRALTVPSRLYLRLTWLSGALGVSAHPYQTPFEFGQALAEALGPRGNLAAAVVHVYVRERFGASGPSEDEVSRAVDAWRRLRPVIALRIVRRLLPRRRERGSHRRVSWTELQ
jgi:transglutaminase-like putative cysteine protease